MRDRHSNTLTRDDIRPGAQLMDADLAGADLYGVNLSDADLQQADLADADLAEAQLTGANLAGANLTGANLRRANLADANLGKANLGKANLARANLVEASLGNAPLRNAYLKGTYLRGADLAGADLRDAVLSGADLRDAVLTGADLTGANLEDAILGEAAEETLSALPYGPWLTRQDNPMILRMVDWRGCSALEYVPGRNGGKATFIGRRIPAQTLVDWLTSGDGTLEDFPYAFGVDIRDVIAVYEYMLDSPPVGTVDLTGCCSVELTPQRGDSYPVFVGTRFPVEPLFYFFKAGGTAREFSDTYDVDYEHVEAVVRHAADQDYQGPLGQPL